MTSFTRAKTYQGGRGPPGSHRMLWAPLRPQETFGSWFRATACLHGCSRLALARALTAERSEEIAPQGIDWDLQPPALLMAALEQQLPVDVVSELRRRIPAHQRDLLRPQDRGALCLSCMQEGHADPAWDRYENLWWWSVACPVHQCPLVGISWFREDPPELRIFKHTPDASRPHITIEPTGRPMPRPLAAPLTSVALGWMLDIQGLFGSQGSRPRQIQHRFRGQPEFDESATRLILRDLVMVSACDVEGMTLLEWGLPDWRRWVWRSADGCPLAHPHGWVPLGDLYLRQEAIRLAGQIWRWLHGDRCLDRPLDHVIFILLRELRATTSYGRLFGEIFSHWPRVFRAKWTQAFGGAWYRAQRVQRALHVPCERQLTCRTQQRFRLHRAGEGQAPIRRCSTRLAHPPHAP